MSSLPPEETVYQLVRHLRLTFPDENIRSWPQGLAPQLKPAWEHIAKAYRLALDPTIPWMEQTSKGDTYLQAAYRHHTSSTARIYFPTPARLSTAAHALIDQEKARQKAHAEAEQQKALAEKPAPRDPSFSILKLYQEALQKADARRLAIQAEWQVHFQGWKNPPRPLYRTNEHGAWTGDHEYNASTRQEVEQVLGSEGVRQIDKDIWPDRATVRLALGLAPTMAVHEIAAEQRLNGKPPCQANTPPTDPAATDTKPLVASRGLTHNYDL